MSAKVANMIYDGWETIDKVVDHLTGVLEDYVTDETVEELIGDALVSLREAQGFLLDAEELE